MEQTSCGTKATSPFLMENWDTLRTTSFLSVFPEEGEQRVGIIEECLWSLLEIVKERKRSIDALMDQQLSLAIADEAEERRFLEEDARYLPYCVFIELAQNAIVTLIEDDETEQRAIIEGEYNALSLQSLAALENVGRMGVCTEALDSIFLKLCQVQPQWMWRRLTAIEGCAKEPLVEAQHLVKREEKRARQCIETDRVRCMLLAGEVAAFAEKGLMLANHQAPNFMTAATLFEDSAIKIQTIYRRYAAQRRYHQMRQECFPL